MSGSNCKTDDFLDLYKRLESCINERYQITGRDSGVGWLIHNPQRELGHITAELDYCREVRNLLAHRPKVSGEYAVEPSGAMLKTLQNTINRILNPPLALVVGVPASNVFSCALGNRIKPALHKMAENCYTHVPIIENNRVVGAFSENTLLSCLIDDEIMEVSDETRFSDVSKYLSLDAHTSESFIFVSRTTTVAEVAALLADATNKAERVGMVFITEHGKPTEGLLGIITAWDLAGHLQNAV